MIQEVIKSSITFHSKITVCGFRDIGDAKKLKFNAEEIQNINEIKSDSTFILGETIDF